MAHPRVRNLLSGLAYVDQSCRSARMSSEAKQALLDAVNAAMGQSDEITRTPPVLRDGKYVGGACH